MNGRLEWRAERDIFSRSIKLYLFSQKQDGRFDVATNITMTTVEDGSIGPGPLLHIRQEEAQALMDELWFAGLRPSEGTGSAGSLAATQKHLEDMRDIGKAALRKHGIDCK